MIPYFISMIMLFTAGNVIRRVRGWSYAFVYTGLPMFTSSFDFFVDGNQTDFRMLMLILYSFLVIMLLLKGALTHELSATNRIQSEKSNDSKRVLFKKR